MRATDPRALAGGRLAGEEHRTRAREEGASGPVGPRRGRTVPLALLVASLGLAAGCGGPTVRTVPTTLGRDARLLLEPQRPDAEPVELQRAADGTIRLPLGEPGPLPLEERVRVREPRKPDLVIDLEVYRDPPPAVEDDLHFRSGANAIVVKSVREGIVGQYDEDLLVVYPEPLALLKDPFGGPWFLPRGGQGLVLLSTSAQARVRADGRDLALTPLPGGRGAEPLVVQTRPGAVGVEVRETGKLPYIAEHEVDEGVFRVLAVRLAPERAGK